MITPIDPNTESTNSQETKQQTYEEQLAASLLAKNVAEAKQRGIPLWMLTGFPATSDEPDEDDQIEFL